MLYNTNTGSVESKQSSQARSFGNEKEDDPLKGMQNMTETQKIALLGDQINTQITDLDMKLDDVLAKHEKDFLKAYRFHMLKVQEELSTLKQRANEKELKNKQDKKITALEQEISKYRDDCSSIMKYCQMQKQLIADYTLRRRELREDEVHLETEVA